MRTLLKHLLVILPTAIAIFFISFALEGKTTYECTSTYEEQPLIYVTENGSRYHFIGCHYLAQSRIEKGLYEAQKSGYRACSYCGGLSYRTIQVEHIECIEVTCYKSAILYSAVRSAVFTAIIYMIFLYCSYERKKASKNLN